MENISLLLFCHNDQVGISNVLDKLAGEFEDIVIVDSSGDKKKLKDMAKSYNNIRIYRVVSLGLRDMFEPWIIKKCRNEWILQVDADEMINEAFVADLDKICKGEARGFQIRRWEDDKKKFYTWQTRLFKKEFVNFNGLPHRQAEILGKQLKLPNKYCMYHLDKYRMHNSPEYNKLLAFEQFKKIIIRDIALEFLHGRIRTIPSVIKRDLKLRNKYPNKLKAILQKEGIVKFLGFDKDSTVREFNKKYRNNNQDADLLIKLILEQYKKINTLSRKNS